MLLMKSVFFEAFHEIYVFHLCYDCHLMYLYKNLENWDINHNKLLLHNNRKTSDIYFIYVKITYMYIYMCKNIYICKYIYVKTPTTTTIVIWENEKCFISILNTLSSLNLYSLYESNLSHLTDDRKRSFKKEKSYVLWMTYDACLLCLNHRAIKIPYSSYHQKRLN